MLSETELTAIDDWRFANRIGTRSEAVRRLCQIAIGVEPLILDLRGLWENVMQSNIDIQHHVMDAAANVDTLTGKESLLETSLAVQKLSPTTMELAVHATAMESILASLKSGETMEFGIEDVKRRIRENEELRQFVKNEWGSKE